MIPCALTIAGSDSGGCAGIQADLKTFGALGVHGMSAVTAVTAQNTQGVLSVFDLPAEEVGKQIEAVAADIALHAVKTGMLSNAPIIRTVAEILRRVERGPLVVDPVMVATSGDPLLADDAVATLREELFPMAVLVTPNRPEAELLTGESLESDSALCRAAEMFLSWGASAVVIKGGHRDVGDSAVDHFFDAQGSVALAAPRIPTGDTHGSGCTFAAAVTAELAKGRSLRTAVATAKDYVTEAIRNSLRLGRGRGPLGHFHASAAWKGVFGGS